MPLSLTELLLPNAYSLGLSNLASENFYLSDYNGKICVTPGLEAGLMGEKHCGLCQPNVGELLGAQ